MTTFDVLFADQRVMAILRGLPPEETVELAGRVWDLGVAALEVPIGEPGQVASLTATVHAGGVATATEVHRARVAGCGWVKAFPAASLGTAWFRAMRGPFPDLSYVATGGMTARTARDYLDAGARLVALGAALTGPDQVDLLADLVSR